MTAEVKSWRRAQQEEQQKREQQIHLPAKTEAIPTTQTEKSLWQELAAAQAKVSVLQRELELSEQHRDEVGRQVATIRDQLKNLQQQQQHTEEANRSRMDQLKDELADARQKLALAEERHSRELAQQAQRLESEAQRRLQQLQSAQVEQEHRYQQQLSEEREAREREARSYQQTLAEHSHHSSALKQSLQILEANTIRLSEENQLLHRDLDEILQRAAQQAVQGGGELGRRTLELSTAELAMFHVRSHIFAGKIQL